MNAKKNMGEYKRGELVKEMTTETELLLNYLVFFRCKKLSKTQHRVLMNIFVLLSLRIC